MENQLATVNPTASVIDLYTDEQLNVIRQTVAPGATEMEFLYFLNVANKRGLDVFAKQIHFVKRFQMGKEVGTIQTGIDGFRLIADRTNRYAPGPEPTFTYSEDGKLAAATAHVRKKVGNDWFDIAATAFYDEYVQTTKDGRPMGVWGKMPRNQLAKCAEALALRKAFPESLSGMYTDDEMEQADNAQDVTATTTVKSGEVTEAMTEAYKAKLDEAEALGIARRELPENCTQKDYNTYFRGLNQAIERKKSPPVAVETPATEVTEGEVIEPSDADSPPAEEEPKKKKASANFITFTNKCKELFKLHGTCDWDNRDARMTAINAWLRNAGYAEVTSTSDIPNGQLYNMLADLGVTLTW